MADPTFVYTFGKNVNITLIATETSPGVYSVTSASGSYAGEAVVGISNYQGADNKVYLTSDPNIVSGLSSAGISIVLADGTPFNAHAVPSTNSVELTGTSPVRVTFTSNVKPVCFAAGVMIRTPEGETAVESLTPGDMILTASGTPRPVRWIGHAILRADTSPEPRQVLPVRISAHAIAPGMPIRDLVVSPGHALMIDGVLITAGDLVNGSTIVQEQAGIIHYYHVELDSHDILIADGMPCESYLEDDNRAAFANSDGIVALGLPFDHREGAVTCLPMVRRGAKLAEIVARVANRAAELGWRSVQRPDLRLVVDGAVLRPTAEAGKRHWFVIPEGSGHRVRLLSNASDVVTHRPNRQDERRLGVAVCDLRIDGVSIDLGGDAFASGFHGLERDGPISWRWTDGDAAFDLPGDTRVVEVNLHHIEPVFERIAPAAEPVALAG